MLEAIATAAEKIAETTGELIEKAAEFAAEVGEKINDIDLDTPVSLDISETSDLPTKDLKPETRMPVNNGAWEGEPGNSKWIPDDDYIPPERKGNTLVNPEHKSWGELKKDYGVDGIEFKDGYPDFSPVSKGTVELEGGLTDSRYRASDGNFIRAYEALAEQRGCTPREVAQWCKQNNYTIHECEDLRTIMKVPHEIHGNIPHDGAITIIKGKDV